MSENEEEVQFGELIIGKPQMFRWLSDDGIEVYIALDHVVGYHIDPEFGALSVGLSTSVTSETTDQEQIDRFLDLWDIV